MHNATKLVFGTVGLVAAGAAALTYARWEAQQYTLRRATVPVLPVGQAPLTILHLSDLHLVPGQVSKQTWVRSLRELSPDAVIATAGAAPTDASRAPALSQ